MLKKTLTDFLMPQDQQMFKEQLKTSEWTIHSLIRGHLSRPRHL
jgi:hypothetical protein